MRDKKIDLLRLIGLSMIILAHTNPPKALFQIRNFDVPLMVLVSGLSFALTYRDSPYWLYLWQRIKRLVFPTWIFLTIYFLFLSIRYSPASIALNTILESYFLLDGIGYVWIIRVFLLVAVTAPIIYQLFTKRKSDNQFLFITITTLLIYELIRYFSLPNLSGVMGEILEITLFYLISYSVIFALGLQISQLNNNLIKKIALGSLISFSLSAVFIWKMEGVWMPTQSFKYPPSIYYLSYSILISMILWMNSERWSQWIDRFKHIRKLIWFIPQNSMWIYLWHILFVRFTPSSFFLAKFLGVYFLSVSITYLQCYLINQKILPYVSHPSIKKNIKILFTG